MVSDLSCDDAFRDNRCVMHRRDAFSPTVRRLMHRTRVKAEAAPA